jgi:subtilase family serine protease
MKGFKTMLICTRPIGKLSLLCALLLSSVLPSWSQANVPSLITQPVDETKLTVLRGNTHPLARPQFDKGAAPAGLPMNHMQLVLRRSPQQEAALDKLMAEQLDRSSPNYHKWLTATEFGEQFGPSDQDVLTVTAWLQSHGFSIGPAAKGKMTIDFSGSASQVQQAFHTPIHKFVVNGEEHWANVKDPSIPTALAPAVVGVASLHNFFPKPQSIVRPAKQMRRPLYTAPAGCSQSTSSSNTNPCFYAVAPGDFYTIYNVPSSLTGAGETIAIVSDSDIALSNGNVTQPSDVNAFRAIFNLPAITFQEIETDPANDPGISGPDGDEVEAVLDVEWSGAVAPNAAIDLVVSPNTNTTSGTDTSASYIIDNKLAPILSDSYGLCELALGTTGNQMHNSMWQQAAAEGITVLVATGDNGSAGCDISEVSGLQVQPAEFGLQVNGLASTPYNVAVGGTDWDYLKAPSTYWGTVNNGTTGQSVLGYVPEMTWNDTCTNAVVIQAFQGDGYDTGTAASTCNDPEVQNATDSQGNPYDFVAPNGASGGSSNCTTSNQSTPSSCSGGYPKPPWQAGPGVPSDGVRDLPDVSLFSSDGLISASAYIDCEEDFINAPCGLSTGEFLIVGGTSVSAQVMAGITALLDQKTGSAQGLLNPILYALATQQSTTTCNASTPAASCVFNNVTVGTIAMPCASASPDCTVTGNNAIGVLTGYNAGTGFNLATGLGSLNVANLMSSWGPTFYISSSNPAVTVSSPGGSGALAVTINSVNGFTGMVALACSGLPSGNTCSFSPSGPVALTSTTTSVSVTVTVQTATGELKPGQRFLKQGPQVPMVGTTALVLLLGVGLFILRASSADKRWLKTALAVAVFSAWMALAGCGGGGSSSSSSGGVPFTANGIVTATSGNVTSSVPFVLTVN